MWCDVVAHPEGDFVEFRSIPKDPASGSSACVEARIRESGAVIWRTDVPTDLLRYLRGAVSISGRAVAIGQGGEGNAWFVDERGAVSLGPTFGQDCVVVVYNPETARFDNYIVVDADGYTLNGVRVPMPHSSQGIREVLPNGTVMFGDDFLRQAFFDGHPFWRRTQKLGWVVGQAGKGIGLLLESGHHFFSFGGMALAEGVHFAINGGKVAVCAATEHGPLFQYFNPPYPPNEPVIIIPAPNPTPVPVPTPTPNPEPTPVPAIFLSSLVTDIVRRYAQRFPVPQWAGRGSDDWNPVTNGASDRFEDRCRKWTWGCDEQVRFETNDPNWGAKNAGGNRPPSKDSLAYNGPRLINYDLLTGVGTGTPVLIEHPQGEDITGQVFMPVDPVNHLGSVPGPVPVPDPPSPPPISVPPPVDNSATTARLDILAERFGEMEANIRVIMLTLQKAPPIVFPPYSGKLGVSIRLLPETGQK